MMNLHRRLTQRSGQVDYSVGQTLAAAFGLTLFQVGLALGQMVPAALPDLKLADAGEVEAMALQPDGKLIISGSFSSVNDQPSPGLARLYPNGSVDLTWTPVVFVRNAAAEGSCGVSPFDGPARVIAASENHVYLGGYQLSVHGADRQGIARLSAVDGSLDASWNPSIWGGVASMALSQSTIYLGGTFGYDAAGQVRSNLAKLSLDGEGVLAPDWEAHPDGPVQKLVLSGTNLFVAGSFSEIGGLSRPGLAKLSAATGTVDQNWNPALPSAFSDVKALVVHGTNLYIAGTPNQLGLDVVLKLSAEDTGELDGGWQALGITETCVRALAVIEDAVFIGGFKDGAAHPYLIKTDYTGSVDATWGTAAAPAEIPNRASGIHALVSTGTRLYVGGIFRNIGIGDGRTVKAALGVGSLDPVTGTHDQLFHAQAQVPGTVGAMVRQPDGRLIVGGKFESAGGLVRRNLLRVNGDGQLDPTWAPSTDMSVSALAMSGNDLFVGGYFSKVDNLERNRLAKVATLGSDAVDRSWDPQIDSSPGCGVNAIAVSGASVFVGGCFNSVGGRSRTALAKLNIIDATLDVSWEADATAPYRSVSALAIDGTNLFVGGNFPEINGEPRPGLAKVSIFEAGLLDTNWIPSLEAIDGQLDVSALAVAGTNLFVGGTFTNTGSKITNLIKLSTADSGQPDRTWTPAPFAGQVQALAVARDQLYVSGYAFRIAEQGINFLARFNALSGSVDPTFKPNPSSGCLALLVVGNDLYAGGSFQRFAGVTRNGFAFQPVADAPVLIQASPTNLFISRNPLDGPEVTHFRIVAISGATLFRADGVTPVKVDEFLTAAEAEAGLKFAVGGSLTVVAAIQDTLAGAGTAASGLTMSSTPAAGVRFEASTYTVREGQSYIVLPVRKLGNGPALVDYSTLNQTAIAGVDYEKKFGTLMFSAADRFKNVIIRIADDLQTEGDEQFAVTLTVSTDNTTIAAPATATVTIVDNDTVGLADSLMADAPPAPAPPATGVLTVGLEPANAYGQWRLSGAVSWHGSGDSVAGLMTDNYQIEFRPAFGFREPATRTIPLRAGVTNQFTFGYAALGVDSAGRGHLSARIQPSDVATNGARWRLRGEGDVSWRDSGAVVSNLNVGTYLVEFNRVSGWTEPAAQMIAVGETATFTTVGTYLFAPTPGAPTPLVIPFASAVTDRPCRYNGQIQTGLGFGSGFVVKTNVVLTAAHVLFNDLTLSYVSEVRWFFQRYRDKLEPPPQTPRGWYIFQGYAPQRELDQSPGLSTPESQNLDAAAMYFLEPAGRGGFGGYLSSDAIANEYLLSAGDKFLAGYPLDGVTETNQGKLHASAPTNLVLAHLYGSVFATADFQSLPGNSGGPLYVQTDQNTYYPAAIYLGGSGQSLVRAINSEVVDLINRADISSNGGGNSTGGGVTLISSTTRQGLLGGQIAVHLTLTNTTRYHPGWRVMRTAIHAIHRTETVRTEAVLAGQNYTLTFDEVPGFVTPSNYVTPVIQAGTTITLLADYVPISPQLRFTASHLTLAGLVNVQYRVDWATDLTAPVNWTALTSLVLTNTSHTLTNAQPLATGARFYRAQLVP